MPPVSSTWLKVPSARGTASAPSGSRRASFRIAAASLSSRSRLISSSSACRLIAQSAEPSGEPADQPGYLGHGQPLQDRHVQRLLQVARAGLGNRPLQDHQELGYRQRIEADLAWPGVLIPAECVRPRKRW